MTKLVETPLPWMAGLSAGFGLASQVVGRLLHTPEIAVNTFTLAAGLAGLVYGWIVWAETGKHRLPSTGKK